MKRALLILATIVACALVAWFVDSRTIATPAVAKSTNPSSIATPETSDAPLDEPASASRASRVLPSDGPHAVDEQPITGIVLDPDQKPLAGAAVFIGEAASEEVSKIVLTDAQGRFALTPSQSVGWPASTPVGTSAFEATDRTIRIAASASGFAPSSVVEVPHDAAHDVTLQLTRPLVVRGTLLGVDGHPVAGTNLIARPAPFTPGALRALGDDLRSAMLEDMHTHDPDRSAAEELLQPHARAASNRDGYFMLGGLWPGVAYDVVRPSSEREASLVLATNIRPGGNELVLHLPHTITLSVGELTPHDYIRVSRDEGEGLFELACWIAPDKQSGPIALDCLVPGIAYGFEIISDHGVNLARGPITIALGDDSLHFEPRATGTLDVMVVDADHDVRRNELVCVVPDVPFPCVGRTKHTGADGFAHFERLESGTWRAAFANSPTASPRVLEVKSGLTTSARLVLPLASNDLGLARNHHIGRE